jgi:uncharacterized protein (UPF0335 family)
MPSTETSVADDQLAAFIDRILRMKEEADAIAADIREIYAEAKANGFDKTQLGNVITYLRKKDKDAAKLEEGEAVFDLYLGSYLATKNRAPRVRAYARAGNGPEITEPQPAPQAERDLTDPKPLGQVADIQLETVTTRIPNASGRESPEMGVLVTALDPSIAGSSNGRTAEFDSADAGSTPAPASIIYPAPGVVVMETCPPEGALAHPYAACWPVRDIDVSEGVREPIVKIGKLILDGRGRMFASRGWDGGKGREYPVVQYDGTDPLMDCIRWNLASRPGIHSHNLKLIAGKLAKLEPTRADEIMQAFGLEVAEAAQ